MQEERQLRRRQQASATGNHVTRGRMKIRSPAVPFSKWEPPPYQQRDSPTEDVRRPSRIVGGHAAQVANHFDSGPVDPPASQTGRPAGHSHHPRVSVTDTTGVVIHRSLKTKDGRGRRQPRCDDTVTADCGTTRKAAAPAEPLRRDRLPRRPPRQPEPPASVAPPPFNAVAQHSVVVPVICNFVDPAPTTHGEDLASALPQVDNHRHHQPHAQLLMPPSAAAGGTPVTVQTSSGFEIGVAVENEVREVKRMLRSFMAKLSQRDLRERNAFEWRIVALALDRLFFIIYLIIIIVALGSMFPWREVFELPKLAKTAGTK